MSAIEEAWIEAVARALCKADGWTSRDVAHAWKAYRSLARAAIRALAPLIIERCAEVAKRHAEEHARSLGAYGAADVDSGRGRQEGHIDAGNTIAQIIRALNHFGDATEMVRALIQKEPSCAPAGFTSPPR